MNLVFLAGKKFKLQSDSVIPAKAGIQLPAGWIPAFAGRTRDPNSVVTGNHFSAISGRLLSLALNQP